MTNYFKWLGERFKTIGTTESGHALSVSLTDGEGSPIIADLSGGLRVLSEIQSAVHDGLMFSYSIHDAVGLAAGSSLLLLGRVGTKQVHFDGFHINVSQGDLLVEFFEAPTVTNAGTLQTSRRRNRSNTTTATMAIYANPTVSANGTLLDDDLLLLVGQGSNVLSGTASVEDGWVLKENTDYLIKITNNAASATTYNAKFAWHEATYSV